MQYDFNMNANAGMDISATGRMVKYKSGLGAIRVKTSAGAVLDLTPGQGARLPKEFISVHVDDRSGNANAGILLIGDYDFQDDTIAGVVSIVDGGKNSTLSKNCFLGNWITSGLAGNFSMVNLINPAGSGKNVIVESVIASLSSATTVAIYMLGLNPTGSTHAQNKYAAIAGGQPSAAFIEGNTTNLLSALGTACQQQAIQPGMPMTRKFAEPLIIPPGMAVCVANVTMAQGINVDFEFREDPI